MPKAKSARPAVSVIIPAYRASRDIADALASVFSQTFTDFEVVVVDDGSPDAAELEAAIAPFRSRIRFIAQSNLGAGAARNTAIRASTVRLLAFLDADDLWSPEKLARQMECFVARPELQACVTHVLMMWSDGMREEAENTEPVVCRDQHDALLR